MNKCCTLLLCLTGCVSTAVDTRPHLVSFTSRAEPLLVLGAPAPAKVVDWVAVEWEEADPSIRVFNFYYSSTSPHVYDQAIFGITNLNCVVSNMVPGTTNYMSVAAVGDDGTESDLSDQYVFLMPLTMEFGFTFGSPVTNVLVQSSNDLMTWQSTPARGRTNGLWRIDVDPSMSPRFYRGVGQAASAL